MLDPYVASSELKTSLPAWVVRLLEWAHGPDIAFGTPGVLMLIATIIFWLGRNKFVHLPPSGLKRYWQQISERENLKALGNLLMIVPFVAIFWALWQQNFSSWVLQSEKMDRHLFGIDWKPSQIQTVNPIFILLMLPLFTYLVYPAIDRIFKLTPLRKIGMGLFVTGLSFLIVAGIQVSIDAGHTPHILWQVLAFLVLTAAEVMVSVTFLEFCYTQAPRKLKSLVMCAYLGAISLGNLFTSGVNLVIQRPDGSARLKGAPYFLFFVAVMWLSSLLFVVFSRYYRGTTYIQEESVA